MYTYIVNLCVQLCTEILWLSHDLIGAVLNSPCLLLKSPSLCGCVWVGKLQWIAVNHVQCTFFSFVKLPFMHV